MNIKTFKLSELQKAEYNPRTITPQALKGLQKSIERFGYLQPIIVNIHDKNSPTIVGGHQRLKAMLAQGIKEEKCVVVDFDQTTEKAANIALNSESISGDWMLEGLEDMLGELKCDFPEFDQINLDTLAKGLKIDLDNLGEHKDADIVPKVSEKIVIKTGDLIELGQHRLLCGDSTKPEDIKKLLGHTKWDCLIFDPPYELEELYSKIPEYQKGRKLVVFWDFKRFAIAPAKAIKKKWTPQYEFIWDNVTSWYTPNRPLQRHKSCGVFCDDPFFNTEKAIIHDGKERKAKIVSNTRGKCNYQPLNGAKHISTVEQFQNTKVEGDHGHAKPMDWIQAIYEGLDCESFFDMFGGSGSTLLYAEKNNKRSFTLELEPEYCQVIVQRWVDFTGNTEISVADKIIDWNELCGE